MPTWPRISWGSILKSSTLMQSDGSTFILPTAQLRRDWKHTCTNFTHERKCISNPGPRIVEFSAIIQILWWKMEASPPIRITFFFIILKFRSYVCMYVCIVVSDAIFWKENSSFQLIEPSSGSGNCHITKSCTQAYFNFFQVSHCRQMIDRLIHKKMKWWCLPPRFFIRRNAVVESLRELRTKR